MSNSIRDAMEEALKQQGLTPKSDIVLDTDDEDVAPVSEGKTSEDKPVVDATADKPVEQKVEKKRDETGKLTKPKGENPLQANKEIPNAQKQEGSAAPKEGTTETAPATFSKEEQAQWENVPPLVKNAIHRINTQTQTAILQAKQELAETKRENAARDSVLEPYTKLWMANGVPVQQGLATAMKAVYEFERDPKGMLFKLAKQYGISLTEEGNDQYVDPAEAKINQLEQKLMNFEQSQSQAQIKAAEQRNMEETDRFINAVDGQGNPLHPHWERVLPQLQALIPAIKKMNPQFGPQDLLKRSYEIACQQNEEVRNEIASGESARKQQEEFEKRTALATKARGGMVSAPAASAMSQDNAQRRGMSIRDSLKAAFQDGLGRV